LVTEQLLYKGAFARALLAAAVLPVTLKPDDL
jgi:hypothetical protein